MKLNRSLLVVAALSAGSLGIMGCNAGNDAGANATPATAEQTVASNDVGASASASDEGTVEYARFGHGRRGRGERGFRGRGGRGFRGGRGEHRAWWRFW